MRIATAILSILLLLAATGANAQDIVRDRDAQLYPTDVRYDPGITTPEDFLGRPLGAAPVRHHELVQYIELVAEQSDRLTVEVAGLSHERRPIQFVVATSPGNHARLDDIRTAHIGLTEPDVDEEISDDMPVVTWLGFGVHGTESSGMDAALPTVYYLAAAQGASVDRLLTESVILVVALLNPDGHANRIAWLDTFSSRIPIADPAHIEHNFDGRLARTNHYGFDLNRQWLSVTQPESRAWMRKWHEWRPNVSVDYHEMGSNQTYYFAPGVPTRNHPLIPDEGYEMISDVVAPSERFFDEQSRLYYHSDSFDHFFLGKGAGFPMVNGGIGILHEASAARGIEIETVNGLRTYRENILKQFRTAIGNATGAVEQRAALLDFQKRFYDEASERARNHPVKGYVFDAPGDDARLQHFVDLLVFHRINVYRLNRDVTQGGITYPAGRALTVPLDQPQHTLIRAIFDTQTEFEDTTFYDVSSWTVPLSFNLDHAALSGRQFNNNLIGEAVTSTATAVYTPDGPDYAYAFEWSGYYAPRALYRVLDAGLYARVALNPFVGQTTRGNVQLDRGTVVVSFDRQEATREAIHEVMQTIAREDGVFVHSLTSGLSGNGTAGHDVGGPFYRPLTKPEVLLVVGRSNDWYNSGEIWHLLDYRMNIPVTLRDRSRLGGVDLSRYTHLIFAGGSYGGYRPSYVDDIRQWVDDGGTIVGIRQGATWVRDNILDGGAERDGDDDDQSGHEGFAAASDEPERFDYAEKRGRDPLQVIGGTIFAGDLDITHPLGFGYARRDVPLMKNMSEVFARPDNPYASVITYATPPVLSGYASTENQEQLEGSAALIAERKRSGSIILYADDPNFRGIWYGTNKLFLNSLFFSRAFEPPRD